MLVFGYICIGIIDKKECIRSLTLLFLGADDFLESSGCQARHQSSIASWCILPRGSARWIPLYSITKVNSTKSLFWFSFFFSQAYLIFFHFFLSNRLLSLYVYKHRTLWHFRSSIISLFLVLYLLFRGYILNFNINYYIFFLTRFS